MDRILLQELRARRPSIRREWLTLLRAEPVGTPLGNPEALAHLIDRTLDELFAAASRRRPLPSDELSHSYDTVRRECGCGRNPLLAYFLAGERAVLEALIQVQSEKRALSGEHPHHDLTELYLELRRIARREVRSFCSICQAREAEVAAH